MAVNYGRSMLGGDLASLAGLASRLVAYPPQMQPVYDVLKSRTDKLVNDAGWWGDAAGRFRVRWQTDSTRGEILSKVIRAVATIVGTLAEDLRIIESDLEQCAGAARAAGVPVAETGELLDLPPTADAAMIDAAARYSHQRDYMLSLARQQRIRATADLMAIDGIIGPPEHAVSLSAPADSLVTAGDLMGQLYALPASSARWTREDRIPKLKGKRDAALKQWRVARDMAHSSGTAIPQDIKDEHRSTLRALNRANAELDGLERSTNGLQKLIDARIPDLVQGLKVAEGDTRAAKLLKGLSDVPFVDAVAGVASTGLLSYDDMQKGEDWTAIAKEGSAQVAAIAVGGAAAGVTAVVVVAGAAAIGVSAPVIVVGGAALVVGTVVAVGVGDEVSNAWHEHWDEDIHRYGVAGGIVHGIENVDVKTLKDMGDQAKWVGNTVSSTVQNIWHGIFG